MKRETNRYGNFFKSWPTHQDMSGLLPNSLFTGVFIFVGIWAVIMITGMILAMFGLL